MNKEVGSLGSEVAGVVQPSKFSKNDLYPWREIFELSPCCSGLFFHARGVSRKT